MFIGMITLVGLWIDYLEEWIKVVIWDGGRGTLFKNYFSWVNFGDYMDMGIEEERVKNIVRVYYRVYYVIMEY